MKLKYFEKYINNLSEIFDYEYDIAWKKFNMDLVGYFNTEKNKYRILIVEKGYDIYYFKFQILTDNSWHFFSSNDENEYLKVLSTIRKQVIKFLENYNPNSLIFFSFDKSKSNLYKKFCEYLVQKGKYNYFVDDNDKIFIIYDDNTDFSNIKDIMKNLKDENYNYDQYDLN